RNGAADIAQHLITGVVDLARFADRTMVHPDDDITLRIARPAHRDRRAVGREHDQRARRIEADTLDGSCGDRGFRHGGAHGSGTGIPDVGRRLFDDVTRLVPGHKRMLGKPEQLSGLVEYAGSRARGPDIDADKSLPHARPLLTEARAYQHV